MIVYAQNQFLPLAETTVSISDHGFLYGVGLFETFRSWNKGRFFFLDRHLSRLTRGCPLLGIAPDALELRKEEKLRPILAELRERNEVEDAVFRYTVSAGEPTSDAGSGWPYEKPTEMVLVRPLPPDPISPIALHLLTTRRTPPETENRIKSFHYFNSLAGRRELREREADPADEGIMLTADDRVAEGTVSNVFIVEKGILKTPSPASGLLPGISRGIVLELAAKAGIPARETDLDAKDLAGAEAAFVTNAVIGIQPAAEIRGLPGAEAVVLDPDHPVLRLLRQGWTRCMNRLSV